jgi:diacylglycerol kinase family enzyme
LYIENVRTVLAMAFNGKLGGGGMIINPYAVMNDGLLDFALVSEKMGAVALTKLLDKATKQGGIHAYDTKLHMLRGKKFRLVNKNPPPKKMKNGQQNW